MIEQITQDFEVRVRVMRDVEDLSYDEVAGRLQVPVGTVKSRHARGRTELRRVFESTTGASPPGEEPTS